MAKIYCINLENLVSARAIIETSKPRSAWNNGVKSYALELLNELTIPYNMPEDCRESEYLTRLGLTARMLNGASTWKEYSDGGCALVYDTDIAGRLCNPSEFRRYRGGAWNPNRRETWLDVQARALNQAANLVIKSIHN